MSLLILFKMFYSFSSSFLFLFYLFLPLLSNAEPEKFFSSVHISLIVTEGAFGDAISLQVISSVSKWMLASGLDTVN